MQSTWRVACVRVPRFALGAVWCSEGHGTKDEASAAIETSSLVTRRSRSDWDTLPLALVRGGRVIEATPSARRAGLSVGGTGQRTRQPFPQPVELLEWEPAAVDREVTRVTALLLAASPEVTPVAGAPGMWWVGVGGPEQAGVGERNVVRALARVARRWHPGARVGVASSCVAARTAVWGDAPGPARASLPLGDVEAYVRIVPRGGCAAFIAAAPIGFVPMDGLLRRTLLAAGIRTVGALATQEASEVAHRWGAPGMAAWRLARGEDSRRPVLAGRETRRVVVAELATPATTVGPVLALVRAALERLTTQLATERRLAAAVALTLTLDDGRGAHPAGGLAHTVTRELRLPCPLATAASIASRCQALLARWTPQAPVCGVRVEITATAPSPPPSS